jgi:hypothetical protein
MLNDLRAAIKAENFTPVIRLPSTKEFAESKNLKPGEQYPINYFHPFTEAPESAGFFTLAKIEKKGTNTLDIYFTTDDPIYSLILLNDLARQSVANYPIEDQPAEYITHAMDGTPIAFLKLVYPELLPTLTTYMNKIEAKYYPIYNEYELSDPLRFIFNKQMGEYPIRTEQDRLTHMNRVQQFIQDKVTDPKKLEPAIISLEHMYMQKLYVEDNPILAQAYNKLYTAELYFLKGDMVNAALMYKQSDHLYEKLGRTQNLAEYVFDKSPGSLKNYKKAIDILNEKKLNTKGFALSGRLEREYKRQMPGLSRKI